MQYSRKNKFMNSWVGATLRDVQEQPDPLRITRANKSDHVNFDFN